MLGFDASVVERGDDLQSGQYPQVAVEAAAGTDRVDVRSGHHGRTGHASGARADDVADGVNRDRQPQFAHPVADKISTGLVFVGERQTGAAAAVDGADGGQFGQASVQTGAVDA